jgi:GNAT superfamily N-acetyltransferase
MTAAFPLVDQYMSELLDVDLSALEPGQVEVVESPRRLRPQLSYGFIHALWWLWLTDGRSAVSVTPGVREVVVEIVESVREASALHDPRIIDRLRHHVNGCLLEAGLGDATRSLCDVAFACNTALLRRHARGDCQRLVDDSIPAARGLSLPTHCFPDGIVYAVVVGGEAISIAFAHRSGVMEDRVVDLGIETAPGYRRRGYAQTAVSAIVEHMTRDGGEARYGTDPENQASIATARSVGFAPYATSLVLAAPVADPEA